MSETKSPQDLVAELITLLTVRQDSEDRFIGSRKIGGVGRVFGGQVIAQALASAELTVAPERQVHSLHAYFLRGGSEDHEIVYSIKRDFDGGSFSNRRVVASQQGTPILNLAASFHRPETGISHTDTMPEVAGPDGLANELQIWREAIHQVPEKVRDFVMRQKAIEVRPVDPQQWLGFEPGPPQLFTWFRASASLPDDPRIHRAILAYASDYTLLGTCTVPHGLSWTSGEMMGASLDHAVWFHDSFRADEWLLYATDSLWAGGGRGFNRGRIFTQDGRLVAETAQEGLIRLL